ncbi:hypothetical protein HZY91_08965 [Facklamia sp. DSM 111018]|uniref:Phospholipid methyltransferase n=1 Tax=Facklamia lactis TaxID=2749967 RepID=A0ABS0LST3_9LACT|nr:methyltransferase [Facklamia lactis]MBG9987017.1 hypothetical protein [Facklamia lactis]
MNAGMLSVLVVLFRFLVILVVNRPSFLAIQRFAPMEGSNEKMIYWLYQLLQAILLAYPFLLKIEFKLLGIIVMGFGMAGLFRAIHDFGPGLVTQGIYSLSRHPMYLSYYLIYASIAIMTSSMGYGLFVFFFIIVSHFIILSEEKWCLANYGQKYVAYQQSVPMYMIF